MLKQCGCWERLIAIVAEHDDGEIGFEGAVDVVAKAGLRALIYTSPSPHGSQAATKWPHLILPLLNTNAKLTHAILVAAPMTSQHYKSSCCPSVLLSRQSPQP